jgi:hypothetical protein
MEQYLGSSRHKKAISKGGKIRAIHQKKTAKIRIEEYNKNPKKCLQCGGPIFHKTHHLYVTLQKKFCNHSCHATYQNTHKTKGTRTSKLEVWLQGQLRTLYPDEEILFNDKTVINSELDIYFPRLKLAFELNGIFHYEPIYGKEKLTQIQNNDQRKFLLCQQKGISLCVIDASKENYFKVERSKRYLDIIKNVLAEAVRFARTNPIKD